MPILSEEVGAPEVEWILESFHYLGLIVKMGRLINVSNTYLRCLLATL